MFEKDLAKQYNLTLLHFWSTTLTKCHASKGRQLKMEHFTSTTSIKI